MMRKCKLNSEQFSKKFSCYRTAVNSRSRYEHRIYLKRLGIEPNSKQARMSSRSTKNRRQSNSDDDEPSTKTVKKTVSFSDQLTRRYTARFWWEWWRIKLNFANSHFFQIRSAIARSIKAAKIVPKDTPWNIAHLRATTGAFGIVIN